MCAHRAVQQAAVMADDQHRVGVAREVAFQPQRAFEVEVVRRLVQKQQVGLREEHPASATRIRQPPEKAEQGIAVPRP
jgi:hypothetical protein